MRAGILTFHEANNYGAVLQAYALQQTLRKMDVDSELISVLPDRPDSKASPMAKASPFLRRMQEAGAKRAQQFDTFRREHLACSAPCSEDSLGSLNSRYDFFIAGSDQIWNIQIPDADPRYFLPFADPGKCFSYAASFGSTEIPPSAKDWIGKQLSRFSSLSVREEAGRDLIRELIGREASVCLDPTLLLDQGEWGQLITPISRPPYVLLYMLKHDELLVQKALAEANKSGIDLVVITGSFIPQFGLSSWSETGVLDWLSLLAGAEGVFTNSFHGAALSLVFEKPLCVELLGGELGDRNCRIEELLKVAGLDEAKRESLALQSVNPSKGTLTEAKDKSMRYLQSIRTER